MSCFRHQNVILFLDLGPTVSSHHKNKCSPITHKLNLNYQHSNSTCLLPITQSHPDSYSYTKEKKQPTGKTTEKLYKALNVPLREKTPVWCYAKMYRKGDQLQIRVCPQDPAEEKARRPRKQPLTKQNLPSTTHHFCHSVTTLLFPSFGCFHFSLETG